MHALVMLVILYLLVFSLSCRLTRGHGHRHAR